MLLVIVLFGSCSSLYLPNVPNTPMLSAKGELHASGHVSLRGNISLNSAYAVSDHFGVLFNGSVMDRKRGTKEQAHNLVETAGGYLTTFGQDGTRVLELYAGLGRGNGDRFYKQTADAAADNQQSKFNKTFFQANFSSKKEKSLKLFSREFPLNYGTALRVSYLRMTEFTRNGIDQPKEDNIFLEPVFFTRMALNSNVQLQYTSGSNFGLKNRKFLTAGNSVFTVGIVINAGGTK
ncbi:hypothetical protein GS398_03615 [Pedobacter sp. HMF7056]|uniref:DUF481 domain-containing protein n=1 Tax=Hufsiella ginkgonis TaxID=2695274 RepID=A0A7K1XTR7_9SPHI|nr:hypothetical protein [Hufsiella ginkgonis]